MLCFVGWSFGRQRIDLMHIQVRSVNAEHRTGHAALAVGACMKSGLLLGYWVKPVVVEHDVASDVSPACALLPRTR